MSSSLVRLLLQSASRRPLNGLGHGLGLRCLAARGLHAGQVRPHMEVNMPSLSPTMTEGTIVRWNKEPGEKIEAGDVLCEIQTDKAVVALDADDDGVMAKIVGDQNSGNLKVGTLIAVIAEDGEDWQEVAKSVVGSGSSDASPRSTEDTPAPAMLSGGSTPGTEVKMPSLSPTMTEGTIVKWCFQEGDKVGAGEVLCEIQTDKAVVSMEIDDDAVLAKILVSESQDGIQVGQLIALTVEEGEDWKDVQIPAPEVEAKPAAETKQETPAATGAGAGAVSRGGTGEPKTATEHAFEHNHNVGPATNLLLALYGLKASDVPASGPKGLLKSDVLNYIAQKKLVPIKLAEPEPEEAKSQAAAAAQRPAPKPTTGYTDHPISSIRGVIAKRLSQSKHTSPHGHTTAAADIDAVLRIRKDYLSRGVKVSVNDFVIKAVATALQHVPEMNLNIQGEDFQIMPSVDISIAVATPTGLITPIITDAANKSVDQIADQVKDLAVRARQGKLQLHEFQGGSFSISNLGMFGIHEFTAIINPPQAGILAVGAGMPEIDAQTGNTVTRMRSTLSFDRRFVDEALAADFMSTFQTILQRPEFLNMGVAPVVRKVRVAEAME